MKDKIDIDKLKESKNIAALLSEEKLFEIGQSVVKGYEIDEESRKDWKDTVDQAMDIAKQVMETKSFPWANASNIKFPLITQASIDYASQTLPEVIQNDKIVKATVVGSDPDNKKYERAMRVSAYMSYQLTAESPDWIEGTDTLLQILPVLGTVFKKTYYSPIEKRCMSELCVPDKIVINYGAQSLESARRITHIITLYTNDVVERQRAGIFLDEDKDGKPIELELLKSPGDIYGDNDSPLNFLEQCCYLDLDDDGYKEPYVVTVHKESGKVFRILNRFDEIEKTKSGAIRKISAEQYYTDFHFIRSPDGGFYSMGFGSLLLPINKAINTLINQLIDSGTLNNTQGGIIGRGLRLKNNELKFKMGQWQVLEGAGSDDVSKSIFPWPTKEPSQTLFSLLSLLMQVGRDLSSTSDVLSGNQNATNVSSSAISQLVEQGTKVFVAINKRLYRSLRKEYQKIYKHNRQWVTQKQYMAVLDDPEADVKADFAEDNMDVCPVADPSISTETQRIQRAGIVGTLRTADPREADRLLLQSMQIDKDLIDRLLPPPDPNAPPPPEALKAQADIERSKAEIGKITAEATLAAEKLRYESAKVEQDIKESDARINEAVARVWKMQQDAAHNLRKDQIDAQNAESSLAQAAATLSHKVQMDNIDAQLKVSESEMKKRIETFPDGGDGGSKE